jgi:hypothetical protein
MPDFGAEARLDRLETHARDGYANPDQMIKLINEVRRRRREMKEARRIIVGFMWLTNPVGMQAQARAREEELRAVRAQQAANYQAYLERKRAEEPPENFDPKTGYSTEDDWLKD